MFLLMFYCVVAGSGAICESDAAVPKPRQTRQIYIEDHNVIMSFVNFFNFFMAVGESLK